MNLASPAPPVRRFRRPSVADFLGGVFPFLSGRDLLACALVSRYWREEADAISLWRTLLHSNPATERDASFSLPLRVTKRLVLQGRLDVSLRHLNQEERVFSPQGVWRCQTETASERGESNTSGGRLEQSFSTLTFSSQIPLVRLLHPVISRSTLTESGSDRRRKSTEILMWTVETIQRRTLRIEQKVVATGDRVNILLQALPRVELLRFHRECLKEWEELNCFEEIIVTLFCLGIEDVALREIYRSFVHIEMANIRNIGSSTHLQWCRFKKALPLDEDYYDYMDCLYLFGPSKQAGVKITPREEFEGKKKLQKFQALRETIHGIINLSTDDARNFGWNNLLERLEIT